MKKRPLIVICRCKSHCTTLNATTGNYEGDGVPQSRSTRDRHSRDDKNLILSTVVYQVPPTTNPTAIPNDWIHQIFEEIEGLMDQALTSVRHPLVFKLLPEEIGPFRWPNDSDILISNYGQHSLTEDRANLPFLTVENRLQTLFSLAFGRLAQSDTNTQDDINILLLYIRDNLGNLTRRKEVEWAQQRGNRGAGGPYVNTEIHFQPFGPMNPAQKVATMISLVMENVFFIPRRPLRILLGGARSLMRANGATDNKIASIPKDPRSGPHRSRLNPTTREFVVCPSCHSLYPFVPNQNPNQSNTLPSHCSKRRTPDSSPCDTPLWKDQRLGTRRLLTPVRKYLHQDLKSWVGRILSRKGMAEIIDNQPSFTDPTIPIPDIWSSNVLRNLKDPSGHPFLPGLNGEGRLIFSLSIDSFNPFHNKTAKQSVSSTGIWMVLLNLPQHLRYLHENMYVAGVIPGPDKPSKEDIYPYVDLLMDDLLEFWFQGVRFSRTSQNIFDRLYRAMLIPLICDMLAARQIVGLGAVTSHGFCTFCEIDIDDIDILDRKEWPTKDLNHIRHIAGLWRDAPSIKDQQLIFESFGIRWSPLHRLPYWDCIRYTVVDPMHALDLNLLQNHCRSIFQINVKHPGGDGSSTTQKISRKEISTKDQFNSLAQCVALIQSNLPDLATNLILHPRLILYTICVDNDIIGDGHQVVVGTKWILSQNIQAWRNGPSYPGIVRGRSRNEHSDIPEDQTDLDAQPGPSNQPSQQAEDQSGPNVVGRVVKHLLNTDEQDTSRTKAYRQGSAAIFVEICGLLDIDCTEVDIKKRTAKRVLFDKILSAIDSDDPEVISVLESFVPEDKAGNRSRPVLGKDVMEAVWADMRLTQLPTWISPAPKNWGTTQRGKLSADNWRVICTIHLPITLIRLWSSDTVRKQDLLSNFMDLVTAVQIANMRVTSATQIQCYNFYMTRYISSIQELYPDQNLKPTHHTALHIGDMLGLFGPNHSHSGPHYERYINFFHRVNTNLKIGQLESTMLNTSVRSANIRAILADDVPLQKSVMELVSVFDQVEREDIRGYRLASVLDPQQPTYTPRSKPVMITLDDCYHRMLCDYLNKSLHIHAMPKQASLITEISRHGVCYGVSTAATYRNSTIIYEDHDTDNIDETMKAGIAKYIFHYTYPKDDDDNTAVEEFFLICEELAPIPLDEDPYRNHLFGGFLAKLTGREVVISLLQVASHFAMTVFSTHGMSDDVIHVLPLDRRMLNYEPFFTIPDG